jgi:hypothetical protein
LKPEIRREVLAQQPIDLSQAAGLARLHEEKFQDLLRLARPRPSPPPWNNSSASASKSPSLQINKPTSEVARNHPPLLPAPPSKTCFRQLTAAELAERREKGLCFNCDERFS